MKNSFIISQLDRIKYQKSKHSRNILIEHYTTQNFKLKFFPVHANDFLIQFTQKDKTLYFRKYKGASSNSK